MIVRDGSGVYAVRTVHDALLTATSWGMFWHLLFWDLFFAPVLGVTVGADLETLVERAGAVGTEPTFGMRIRAALQPGTSALFLILDEGDVEPLRELVAGLDGRVFVNPLSQRAVHELQSELHGLGV